MLFLLLSIGLARADSLDTFKEVLEKRVSDINHSSNEVAVAASYDRIRQWLPRSPQINYWNNDSNTWKAWVINTSVPYPRSFFRDDVEVAQKNYIQASAR